MNNPLAAASPRRWPAVLAWLAGWAAMTALDGRLDLANLAMLLVLSAAVASLWLPALVSVAAGTLAVVVFNWQFVPPRGTYREEISHSGTVKFQCCIHPWMRLEARVSSH